jgi:glycosyltransferase involved in cell wall biosynthesis
MKIVHLISSLKIGGAETALVNFLTSLTSEQSDQPKNTHTILYFHDGPNRHQLERLGIATHQISGLLCRFDPWAFYKAFRMIKNLKPDIIHSSLWMANIFGRLIGKIIGTPVICDLHGSATDEGFFRNRLDALTAKWASALVAVSDSVQQAYQISVINRMPIAQRPVIIKKLSVIANGVDQQKCLSIAYHQPLERKDYGLYYDDFVIGSVGRLEPIKSYDILIIAFSMLLKQLPPNAHVKLCLVGGGSEYQELQSLAQTLQISDKIVFVGARSDAIKFYPLFDCFALSSRSEGLSIALLEALCFGLPIVSTNQKEQHDVLANTVNGLLVPPNDPQALCNALEWLIKNKAERQTMKINNEQLISHYNLASTVQRYKQLYQLLSKK